MDQRDFVLFTTISIELEQFIGTDSLVVEWMDGWVAEWINECISPSVHLDICARAILNHLHIRIENMVRGEKVRIFDFVSKKNECF